MRVSSTKVMERVTDGIGRVALLLPPLLLLSLQPLPPLTASAASPAPPAAAAAAAAAAPDPPRQVDVFIAGQDGYHTYRIPSAIVTPKGAVLAFAEARRASANDAGDIDLVMKRSADGGRKWSALRVLLEDETHRFGDPCPVVDRARGVIWLVFTRSLAADNEKAILAGTSKGARTVWTMKSTDEGESWSTPTEITSQVKRPTWTWYATGPGIGIQTRAGRLVIPANHAEAGSERHASHLFYSDDGGTSWTLGATAEEGTNESQVAELADGRLLLNMRNHPPKQPENFRMIAFSDDGGRTLGATRPNRALLEPPAQASLLRLSLATESATGGKNRLLFSNPASTKRERLTVRLSLDEGETWPESNVIHAGPAAYSCLVLLPDRTIGLLYERGAQSAYERITFATFTLEWLTNGRDRLSR